LIGYCGDEAVKELNFSKVLNFGKVG